MTNVSDTSTEAMTRETENSLYDIGTAGTTTTSKTLKTTPPRHNYHNTNTPIASIKRPRSSLIGRIHGGNNDPSATSNDAPATPMSVMPLDDSDSVLYTPSGDSSSSLVGSIGASQILSSPMPSGRRTLPSLPTDSALSPMHGVRPVTSRDIKDIPSISLALDDNETESTTSSWVGKKVDALFSPVYHFLHHEEQEQKTREQKHEEEKRQGIQVNELIMRRSMDSHPEALNEDSDGDTRMDTSSTPEKNVDGIDNDLDTQPTSSVSSSSAEGTEVLYTKDSDTIPITSGYDVEDDDASSCGSKVKEGLDASYHHGTSNADGQTNRHRVNLNNICGENSDSEDDDHSMGRPEHPTDMDEFNPWHFIKSLPPYSRIAHTVPPITLPPKDANAPEKTLVLDLDETLVHCTVETPDTPADLTFPVVFRGTTFTVHVRLRPFLQTFLDRLVGKYEIIVFTASQKVYANELLNLIDPKGIYIQHRLFRESCLAVDGNFLKDLNVLGRDLSTTILVDNSPHAFGYQIDNGIPIESWFDNNDDRELLKLEKFLRSSIYAAKDVRPVVRQKFQSHKLIEETSAMPSSPNSATLPSSAYS